MQRGAWDTQPLLECTWPGRHGIQGTDLLCSPLKEQDIARVGSCSLKRSEQSTHHTFTAGAETGVDPTVQFLYKISPWNTLEVLHDTGFLFNVRGIPPTKPC